MTIINKKETLHAHIHHSTRRFWNFRWNYFLILPGFICLILFNYVPMSGIVISFLNYTVKPGIRGIIESEWVGLRNFGFLNDTYFWHTVKNTLLISAYRMLVTFPVPIILAIMLNETRNRRLRRMIQSAIYLPYFISWIVVAYIIYQLLALDNGVVNNVLTSVGLDKVYFMGEQKFFRSIIVFTSMWKSAGWGTIIYLAALSNIDPQQQEAAIIDGAGRFKRIWFIDLPTIKPTIIILLILSMPALLSAGYDQIMPLQNPANMEVSEVLDTYVIRLGLTQAKYSLSTAISLVLSLINLGLVLLVNYICRKLGEESLF